MTSDTRSPSLATESHLPLPARSVKNAMLLLKLSAVSFFCAIPLGALATGVQDIRVVPLILQAEELEVDDLSSNITVSDAGAEEWMPANGVERGVFTWLSNTLVSFGFSNALIAVALLRNRHIPCSSGLVRGVIFWAIFMAAPGLGLPPELPLMSAADLTERQWWWISAMMAAVAGYFLLWMASCIPPPPPVEGAKLPMEIKKRRSARFQHVGIVGSISIVAVVIAAIPHIIGAPHPPVNETASGYEWNIPSAKPTAEMAASFSVWVLATSFAYFLCLGSVTSFAFNCTMGHDPPLPAEVTHSMVLNEDLQISPQLSEIKDAHHPTRPSQV